MGVAHSFCYILLIIASIETIRSSTHDCALASRQASVLALCFLMKLDGIVGGMKDGGMSVYY